MDRGASLAAGVDAAGRAPVNRTRFARVKAVFLEVRSAPSARRAALLAERCGADTSLSAEVEKLLRHDLDREGEIDRPALGPGFAIPAPDSFRFAAPSDLSGRTLGNYRLLERVAEGGMGVVYRAEQARPVRQVAIKILECTAPSVVERFHDEADYLGRLQHPGIAQVFEAGIDTTQEDRHAFIAMEWIDGDALIEHCERRELDCPERIHLLARVCDAVCHAHDRGVLHGDLKPANILVDRSGCAKVVDFGIAAALRKDRRARPAGTPGHMAPELLDDRVRVADPRSDVFALGVVLWEVVRNEPCRRLPADARDAPLELGPVDAPRWRDLAAIVRVSTAPHPEDRYPGTRELGADLRRYLAGQTLAARPHWFGVTLWRWVRRRPLPAISACLCAVLAGFAATFGHAADASRSANEEIVGYLLQALDAAEPGRAAEMDALLGRVRREATEDFAGQPRLAVALSVKLAWLDCRRGDLDLAIEEAKRAAELGALELGEDHPGTLEARNVLAAVHLERGELGAAEAQLRRVLGKAAGPVQQREEATPGMLLLSRVLERWGRFAEARTVLRDFLASSELDSPDTPAVLDARGRLHRMTSCVEESSEHNRTLHRRAYEAYRRLLGADHPQTLAAANELAILLCRSTDGIAEGTRMLRELHARACELYGRLHYETLRLQHNLGYAAATARDWKAATDAYGAAWRQRREALGEDHLETLRSLNGLARFSARAGDRAAAARFDDLVTISRAALAPDNWYRGIFAVNCGGFLLRQGEYERSARMLREGIACLARNLDAEVAPRLRRCLLDARCTLAQALFRLGQLDEAGTILEAVYAERVQVLGPGHLDTLAAADALAKALFSSGHADRAEKLIETVLDQRRAKLGPRHSSTLASANGLANMLRTRGAFDRAAALLRRTLRENRAAGGRPQPRTLSHMAICWLELGEQQRAVALARRAIESLGVESRRDHPDRAQVLSVLGDVLHATGDLPAALDAYRESLELWPRRFGTRHPEMGELLEKLARCHEECGEHRAAEDVRSRIRASQRQAGG